MGPRPSAGPKVSLGRIVSEEHLNMVQRHIEKKGVKHVRYDLKFRRKPNPMNSLNGPLRFVTVEMEEREVWRSSSINTKKYGIAKSLLDFWDGSRYGVFKWPHMLPVLPTRNSNTIRRLKALQLARAFKIEDNVNVKIEDHSMIQDKNLTDLDKIEAPPVVAKPDLANNLNWRAVDLEEDGFLSPQFELFSPQYGEDFN